MSAQRSRRRPLSRAVGIGILFVAVIAAASVARGSGGYVRTYVDVPIWLPGAVLVVILTLVACLRVRQSAAFAAAMAVIEVGGLLLVIGLGADALETLPSQAAALIPADGAQWVGVLGGAFLAFFAFIGFENMVNMAEETRDVGRTLPRAIILAMVVAGILYGTVALVAVLAVPPERLAAHEAPLCLVIERAGLPCTRGFAAIALVAVANGGVAEIILIARLAYGMAQKGLVPKALGVVNRRTQVPVRATLLGGAVILVLTVSVPFGVLVAVTSAVTLLVFIAVNASLWRLQRSDPRPSRAESPERGLEFRMPRLLPPLGVAACLTLFAVFVGQTVIG